MIIPVEESWPATLPLPLINFSGAPRNATIVTPAGQAYIARRSRYSTSYDNMAVSWVLTLEQYDIFTEFFNDNLGLGAAAFIIELRYPTNSSLEEWIVKFIDGYEASFEGGKWMIDADFELLHKANFSGDSDA